MKKLYLVALLAIVFMVVAGSAHAQTEVVRFGDNPFCKQSIQDAAAFRQMVEVRKADLAEGFVKAGYSDLYGIFMASIDDVDIQEHTMQPGDKAYWMLFGTQAKVYVAEDMVYTGKEPVPALKFNVEHDRKLYTFVVPKVCGNISLVGIEDIPNIAPVCDIIELPGKIKLGNVLVVNAAGSYDEDGKIVKVDYVLTGPGGNVVEKKSIDSIYTNVEFVIPDVGEYTVQAFVTDNDGAMSSNGCERKTMGYVAEVDPCATNQGPIVRLNVDEKTVFPGESITVDATGCNDPDGEIKSVTLWLMDSDGNVVETKTLNARPYTADFVVPGSGDYQVKAEARDDCNASATGLLMGIKGLSRVGMLVDLGYARQFDPATYLLGRVGFQYKFNRNVSFIGLVGGFAKVHDDEGESAIVVDGVINFSNAAGLWAGIGAGAWITDGDDDVEHENSQADFILNFGKTIWGDIFESNGSIFFEMRSGFDEFDNIDLYGRFAIGLRIFF